MDNSIQTRWLLVLWPWLCVVSLEYFQQSYNIVLSIILITVNAITHVHCTCQDMVILNLKRYQQDREESRRSGDSFQSNSGKIQNMNFKKKIFYTCTVFIETITDYHQNLNCLHSKLYLCNKSKIIFVFQVIKGSEDNTEQYMNLMNAVFTAQKQACTIHIHITYNLNAFRFIKELF